MKNKRFINPFITQYSTTSIPSSDWALEVAIFVFSGATAVAAAENDDDDEADSWIVPLNGIDEGCCDDDIELCKTVLLGDMALSAIRNTPLIRFTTVTADIAAF